MKSKIVLLISFFLCNLSFSQVSVHRNFNLELAEKDNMKSLNIENSLNAFLIEAQNNKYTNEYVDSTHLKKYKFFFNKLSGIGKNSTTFNRPLVLKSYPVEDGNYRLTIAFTGEREGNPFVYQVTELKAIPYNNHYRFYCPFQDNTASFQSKKIDNVTYHFSKAINESKANEFVTFVNEFATQTGFSKPELDYYSFQNLDELLKSYGFLYSARQCNFLCYDLGFTDNEGQVYITGTDNENYVFGYIGDYLKYNSPKKNEIYGPFVRGISTYYGGYGLSYENMEELKQQFREELKQRPEINFLDEFKKGRKSSVNRHFSYYVMSAFLFEEALEKRDFDTAFQLVYSGSDGNLFFENLEDSLNIDESNFHETILRLIKKDN
ncbi:MAG: hypothetical protein AB8F94_25025 [Saprospiraceae bacterium]